MPSRPSESGSDYEAAETSLFSSTVGRIGGPLGCACARTGRSNRRCALGKAVALAAIVVVASCAAVAGAATLSVTPPRVRLADVYDGRQLIVTQDGVDVSRQARYESSQPGVATVDEHGFVAPVAEGAALIVVSRDGARAELPVEVAALDRSRAIDFKNEIIPLLTRYGCNAGGCHGKASGQNGFRLSLFGFDPDRDYQAIVEEARGRRVSPGGARAQPAGAQSHGADSSRRERPI